jgi:hypothetical protein
VGRVAVVGAEGEEDGENPCGYRDDDLARKLRLA